MASDAAQPGLRVEQIVVDLRRLGLRPGMDVLVHSSLSSLGWVEGGAATVVAALIEAVSPGGTVLFPGLTGSPEDGPAHPPVMDVRYTPCAPWVGVIPETARRWPGACRSLHPTHSVIAIGARAARWTEGHERCATPCGEGSPYVRVMDEGGFILLLGCSQESNTSLHALEELAGVPYHLQPAQTTAVVIDRCGRQHQVTGWLHQWGWERRFSRVDGLLRDAGVMREGMVGRATARLIDAEGLRRVVLPILQRDPLFLLADQARHRLR